MYTYIIVDDEPLIRKGTIKKLEPIQDQAACIGEAGNGSEALQLIESLNPDIIITDMNMPILDGTQFLPLLTQKHPEKQIIVISGHKDFEYMKHAITAKAVDYILKPFSREDVQASVLNAIKQIESHSAIQNQIVSSEEKQESAHYEYDVQMLKNIIQGYRTSNVTLTSKKLSAINETHNIILITMHSTSSLEETSMQNYLMENSFGDLAMFLPHTHQKNLGFLVLFVPEHSTLSPKELCRQITNGLDIAFSNAGKTVSFGISQTHHSLQDLHAAFLETVNALNAKVLNSRDNSFTASDKVPEAKSVSWDKTAEFLFRVEAGMTEQVTVLLDELFAYLASIPSCTLYDIKVFCFWLSDQVTYIIKPYFDQTGPNTGNSSMQNILNNMFDLEELKQYYLQFYLNIANLLKDISVYSTGDTIKEMQIYIQRHYQNNLTIEFLSSLFYMNRSYCSHLFKEKTGDTFVNYLNAVRLDKAKQLLRNTDKKMYQIAKSVGYDNVKYFFRVFKKKENVTPEQYRNQK